MTATKLTRRTVLRASAATVAIAAPVAALASIPASIPTTGSDAEIIAAEAEITRLYAWTDAQQADTVEDEIKMEDETLQPVYEHIYGLEALIASTVPTTLVGATAKLRRLLDAEVGLPGGDCPTDLPSLVMILDFLHRHGAAPTHPTRPIWSPAAEADAPPPPMPSAPIASIGACIALVDEWERIENAPFVSDNHSDAIGNRQDAIERELATTPAMTLADAIAKARLVAELERQGIVPADDGPFLARSLAADLAGLAGGAA